MQIDDAVAADIGAAARQAVGVVVIGFDILAPGLAPEGRGDGEALQDYGREFLPLLLQRLLLARGVGHALALALAMEKHAVAVVAVVAVPIAAHVMLLGRRDCDTPAACSSAFDKVGGKARDKAGRRSVPTGDRRSPEARLTDQMEKDAYILLSGGRQVERDEAEQLVVAHLGQQLLAAALQQLVGQAALLGQHGVYPLLHRAAADEGMHDHMLALSDAEGAVGGLVLDGGVPPAVEMDHVRGLGEVQPRAAGLEREDEEGRAVVALEGGDQLAAPRHRRAAVQHQPRLPEDRRQEGGQRLGHLAVLGEDQQLVLALGDLLDELAQAGELAAALLGKVAVARDLRGMVANLLEAHEGGQNHAAALHGFGRVVFLERLAELPHMVGIEGRLRRGEAAVGRHDGLLGKVVDHAAVGLEAAQDVGARQAAQGRVGAGLVAAVADVGAEAARVAEQTGVDEVEERPEVAGAVLDRRAGQGEACPRLQGLDGARLARGGILDGLGLVEHDEAPRHLRQPGGTGNHAVGGDGQIDLREPGFGIVGAGLQPFLVIPGGMNHQEP